MKPASSTADVGSIGLCSNDIRPVCDLGIQVAAKMRGPSRRFSMVVVQIGRSSISDSIHKLVFRIDPFNGLSFPGQVTNFEKMRGAVVTEPFGCQK